MTIKKLKEHLQKQDQDSLLDEILTLYKTFDFVREYYDSRLEPHAPSDIAQKYKKILEEQFCPKKGFPELKYSVARKAISDFKKVCADYLSILDLQLTYVEYGVKCTLDYGDIDERFYNSMESMFEKTLKDMEEYGVLENFQKRCLNIHVQTQDMGWGFGDAIEGLYKDFFEKSS
ncbi:hypothetical protein DB41_DI00040 [Neochlamydia sp. TUME1]|uniref:DUF6155 family protein n=1 Tax=Neochlamydia sp. TUME1 TaxID=1478174 RepID=UPI00057C7F0E|nr:DUF6155 family protein [Neochlamydia sp. TUME1]KIC77046.1 hypothetical protein DB41_DI00040 [Neochlamydia sp. TUME1]